MANNTNQFAKFVSTSSISSSQDPSINLASNCIRDYFGPTVQLVADGLMARGDESTLAQLIDFIETKTRSTLQRRSDERKEILRLTNLRLSSLSTNTPTCPSHASIRASLLGLVQHSVATVKKKTVPITSNTKNGSKKRSLSSSTKTIYTYSIDINRARLFPRYPRFVDFIKKALSETAAVIVEELLVQGRAQTVDAIISTVEQLQQQHRVNKDDATTTITRKRRRLLKIQKMMNNPLQSLPRLWEVIARIETSTFNRYWKVYLDWYGAVSLNGYQKLLMLHL